MNQGIEIETTSIKLLDTHIQLNICSIKNQSKEFIFRNKRIINRNKFNEAIKLTQKKNKREFM